MKIFVAFLFLVIFLAGTGMAEAKSIADDRPPLPDDNGQKPITIIEIPVVADWHVFQEESSEDWTCLEKSLVAPSNLEPLCPIEQIGPPPID